jgi:predicted neutral ceramidase superfamily lipid hydrolase
MYIKHLLSILLILILQNSLANCFTCVFSIKELGVKRVEFLENTVSDFLEPNFKENNIFKPSFLEVASYRSV